MEKKTRKLTEAQIAAFDGLSKLPPKTQSLFTRKEALQRKLPQLQHAIAMGYTAQDISRILAEELGFTISPSSIREALRQHKSPGGSARKTRSAARKAAPPAVPRPRKEASGGRAQAGKAQPPKSPQLPLFLTQDPGGPFPPDAL